MKIVNLLHFYQPHNQQKDILDRIVNESYRPIVKTLSSVSRSKTVINISGGLTELLLANGYDDVIEGLKNLAKNNQVEFTGSAAYHAFLPLLPTKEIKRQIMLNEELNKKAFGNFYKPTGFFPPEMAVSPKLLKILHTLGYKWLAVPQLSKSEGFKNSSILYESSHIITIPRNKRVSSLILSGVCRSATDLKKETKDIHSDGYWFTVMDAETFGHHRIGHEKLLGEINKAKFFEPILASELIETIKDKKDFELRESTWTNEEQDFWVEGSNSFVLWKDPKNPIHKLQWDFTDFVVTNTKNKKARRLLDRALASDQYWWASAKPWWSLEMIELGAFSLKEVILAQVKGDKKVPLYKKAEEYYRKILDQAFEWQRTGYVRQQHLSNSSTHMKEPFKKRAPEEWFNQMMLEFEDEMQRAAEKMEYEKAIKWRDALLKIKNGTDIYDVLHVVDELWSARDIPELKPFLEYSWDEIPKNVKKNLKGIKSEKDFKKRQENSKLK